MHLTESQIEVLRMANGEYKGWYKFSDLVILKMRELIDDDDNLTPKGRQAISEVWQDKQKSEKR